MIVILTIVICLLVLVSLFTQVVIPLIYNRPIWPIFRTSELKNEVLDLAGESDELAEKVDAMETIAKLKARKQKLESTIAEFEKFEKDSSTPKEK